MPRVHDFIPVGLAILCTALLFMLAHFILSRERFTVAGRVRFTRQITSTVIGLLGLLAIIATIPISPVMREDLLKIYGLIVSAIIALSSTTFVGNMLGGFMLQSIGHIRPGDFVQVEGHFGRVSEQGLFSMEIQTPDRDLTTLPNLFLVAHPTTVVRTSGTIVSATVSLGYDVPRATVEKLLVEAASRAELRDPFVWITDLGNFSITYRIAGFLPEVKELLTVRSRLRESMLDVLHEHGVEIVSPTFMNQRFVPEGKVFIARPAAKPEELIPEKQPEEVVFDKAEQAEALEKLRAEYHQLEERIEAENQQLKQAGENGERDRIKRRIEQFSARREAIAKRLELSEQNGG